MRKYSKKKSWQKSNQNHLPIILWVIIFVLSLLLSACGEQESRSTPTYFIPPTISHTSVPIILDTPTPDLPTPTIECTNDLAYIEDVTVPDNTAYPPGAVIEKIWLVENTGTCNWDSEYRVRFVDGNAMGAELEQALFPARSGSQAEIQITFTAPELPGLYYSSWQAYSWDGEPFGETFFIQIIVDPELLPTETPEEE